jgi:hypothetical protein
MRLAVYLRYPLRSLVSVLRASLLQEDRISEVFMPVPTKNRLFENYLKSDRMQ